RPSTGRLDRRDSRICGDLRPARTLFAIALSSPQYLQPCAAPRAAAGARIPAAQETHPVDCQAGHGPDATGWRAEAAPAECGDGARLGAAGSGLTPGGCLTLPEPCPGS